MPEIKTPLLSTEEWEDRFSRGLPGCDSGYVIADSTPVEDAIRHLVAQYGLEDVQLCLGSLAGDYGFKG